MKKILVILLIFVFGLMLIGCTKENKINTRRANTEKEMSLKISKENLPFALGDIVLLKPDGHKAVISEIYRYPWGLYKVTYDSTGRNFAKKKFIKIISLRYWVRYRVTQEHRESHILDQDSPTEFLHYKTILVHWYEIQKKED